MFKKILIANRGEIACRVAATARRLGVRTVAVYSDADAHAQHVHACDEAVRIGERAADAKATCAGTASSTQRSATGAQAVHPGYGFLSENEEFAQACADAGLVFIGPPASAIAAMGSKSAAKALMEKAGVPLVPGYHGEQQRPELPARASRAHRLPGADQGQRRRRRQGHARGSTARRLRRRARVVPARGEGQLRRRPRAGRALRHAPAAHRDPGVRRHARPLRVPVRARLLGAAPPPEGARGSARARHERSAARARWARPRWPRPRRSVMSAPARSSSSPSRRTTATCASTSWR